MPARRRPLEELTFRRPGRPPASLTAIKPALGLDVPDPPPGLRAVAVAVWRRYCASDGAYAAQSSDLPVLERWARMIHQWLVLFDACDGPARGARLDGTAGPQPGPSPPSVPSSRSSKPSRTASA